MTKINIRKKTQRGSTVYEVDMRRYGGGQPVYKTLSAAAVFVEQQQKMLGGVRESKRTRTDWTFQDLFDSYLEHLNNVGKDVHNKQRSIRTIAEAKIDDMPLPFIKVREFMVGDIEEVLDCIRGKRSKKTLQGFLAHFSQALDYAVRKSCVSYNVFSQLKDGVVIETNQQEKPKLAQISEDIIHKIAAVMSGQNKTMFLVSAYTGLREGELRALTWDDIDFDAEEISVKKVVVYEKSYVEQKDGTLYERNDMVERPWTKTDAGMRRVPMAKFIVKMLKEHKLLKGNQKLVFASSTGHWKSPARFHALMQKYCRKAGVEHIRWHDLRHYCASQFLKVYGNDWNRIKTYIGHKSIRTTIDTYGHWIENQQEKEAAKDLLNEKWSHIAEQVQ